MTAKTTSPDRKSSYKAGRERPADDLEFRSWLAMRISGIVLLFLAVGHVLIMHLPAGGVSRVNFAFVAVRWEDPFWRTWDWLLLSLGLLHGVNGLRVITLDYVRNSRARAILNVVYYILGFGLFILGTTIVATFDASKWPA